MELICSMRRKPIKYEPPQISSMCPEVARPLCSISVLNIVAFSSGCELDDTKGDTWGGHVYVCDLDTPWNAHKVANVDFMVSALEWDCEGRQLAVGTVAGMVAVYGQKDHLLNKWQLLYTTSFRREPIVGVIMFHNGRRVGIVDSADANVAERLHCLRPAATLKGLGGVPVDGCLALTSTGILAALTRADGTNAHVSTHALHHRRALVSRACFQHKRDGSMLVAALCREGAQGAVVRVSRCTVRPTAGRPMLRAVILPAVKLNHMPACIAWAADDTDALYIGGANLSLWRLDNRPMPVHKLLIKAGGGGGGAANPSGGPKSDCHHTLGWQRVGAWPLDQPAYCVTAIGHPTPGAVVAAGGTLVRLAANQVVCSLTVIPDDPPPPPPPPGAPPAKRHKYAHKLSLSGCSVSALGAVAVCVDTRSQIHVCTAHTYNTSSASWLAAALHALERSATSGVDALDVLLALAPHAELLHERLAELYARQAPLFHQHYCHGFHRVKVALLRLLPRAHRTVSSLSMVQSAHLAWAACSALLRPDDRADAAPVAALLDDRVLAHHDKALLALEARSEPIIEWSALAALRCQLKRAADIAVTAIAAVPHPHHPYEIHTDPSAVLLLRKLLLVARGDPAVARALCRLPAQHHPKDLVEECVSIAATHSARVWECPPRAALSAPHGALRPHTLDYFVEPLHLRIAPEPPAFLRDDDCADMDSVTYMYMGVSVGRWRACVRCAARAAPLPADTPPAPPPAAGTAGGARGGGGAGGRHRVQRTLTNRMTRHCKCGGQWILLTNTQA